MQTKVVRMKGISRVTHARHYDSAAELVDSNTANLQRRIDYLARLDDWEWVGRKITSPEEVKSIMNKSDTRIVELFEGAKKKIEEKLPVPMRAKRVGYWDEFNGDVFDNDRFRSGQQAWRATRREARTNTNTITLLYSIGGGSCVDERDLVWSPVVALALTDLLENAGYSVKLLLRCSARLAYPNSDSDSLATVVVKDCGSTVDQSTLTNMATGWFFRVVGMGERFNGEKVAGKISDGYGYTIDSLMGLIDPADIDLDFTPSAKMYEIPAVFDESAAITYAKIVLKKIEADQK